MSSETTDEDVERFLTAYGDSLATYDAVASADHWGLPGMILSDAFVGVLDSREDLAAGLTQGYPLYRALGLDGVTHTVLERADVTDRVVRLRVRWHFHSGEEHLVDGDYEYLLRRDDDGLHAYVAVAIDEAEQIAAVAERKGVDLTRFGRGSTQAEARPDA